MTQTTGREPEKTGLITADPLHVVTATPWRLVQRQLLPSGFFARPGVIEALIGLFALVVFGWRVRQASPWFDEAVTRDVTSRPGSGIVDLAEHVDLVHTAYYLLVHAILGASTTVTPIRLISVVAAALTAVLLVRLGRELGSTRVAVAAGLLWTVAPLASRSPRRHGRTRWWR